MGGARAGRQARGAVRPRLLGNGLRPGVQFHASASVKTGGKLLSALRGISAGVTDPARILIRLPNWLGDILLARPLLHALRHSRPGAEIMAIAPDPLLELLRGEGTFDRALAWPTRSPNGAPPRESRSGPLAEVKAWRPDVALILPPSFSSAWFGWRSGARARIGYAAEGRAPLLTHSFRRPARGEIHLSREYLALAKPLGVHETWPAPRLAVPPAAAGRAEAMLERVGVQAHPVVVLGPCASFGPAKRWGAERFAALGRELAGRGHVVLVCGAASERALCETVTRAIGDGAISLAGETDLPLQAALFARAALAVCNDSGLAHLAAATGAPTVVIFGSTSSAWTAPLGDRVRVVQRAPVCSPCFQRTCRIGYRCLTAIEVGDVARACAELSA